ncbi:MAG: hypothetical protein HXX10_27135 [Rhodoplanes sp.]|uniref:TraX family protein n=1 Tax=Rhodoplanes sp. TaxID=1968906 RepID=UPI0017B44EBD|nr:TraX family protein [Rhodoplanes sp.]NVO17716.1 hypothetical protein [Rhodoplanes sp.]
MSASPHPTDMNHRRENTSRAVDCTDWLKCAALVCAMLDHFGHFFMDDDRWWGVVGRLAAPTFFFLIGYAATRTVPLRWLWLGLVLTLLNSWNADWTWVEANILFSLALARLARPAVKALIDRQGWIGFALLVAALVAVQPIAGDIVDYGAEGWLWALFGLCQRIAVDETSARDSSTVMQETPTRPRPRVPGLMRLLACMIAVVFYIYQEQEEFGFPFVHLIVFIAGIGALSIGLLLFRRGPSRIQPPEFLVCPLRFVGRHTLELYAVQLASFELLVKLVPDLAP